MSGPRQPPVYMTAKQIACILRVRADRIWGTRYEPHGPYDPGQIAEDVVSRTLIQLAEDFEHFAAGNSGEFTSEAAKLRKGQ